MDFDYNIHEHEHDEHKLKRKSPLSHNKCYTLKVPDTLPKPEIKNMTAISTNVDLRKKPYMPAALDQGSLGACASHAMANNLYFVRAKEGLDTFHPSRLALYYNCRVKLNNDPATEDTGVTLADLCKSVQEYHACHESEWPYDIKRFADAPPSKAVQDESQHKGFRFKPVQQHEDSIKHCLTEGFPSALRHPDFYHI